MKRIFFLLMLLLIISLISCSNDNQILGPGATDNNQIGLDRVAKNSSVDTSDTTGDDGDPWEDKGVDDGETGPPGEEPEQGDTTGGGGDKVPYDPNDPGTGD